MTYDPDRRYRVYRAYRHKPEGVEEIAGCPDREGIGLMLVTLHAEGEFADGSAIGLLDTKPRAEGKTGTWIISPFAGR